MIQTEELIRTPLFNLNGSDLPEDQQLVNGNPTGISNLNVNKYKWTTPLYRTMLANHWIPEKVDMTGDKKTLAQCSEAEQNAIKDTLSFLIFLDSFQCLNLPNIAQYITAPNVSNLIAIQQAQEVLHTQSYQYILEALYPITERDAIYNRWRHNPELLQRIQYVSEIAEDFIAEPTLHNFKRVVNMNFILESIYFYQGFMFFDQLVSRGKMIGAGSSIDYIRRDEMTHIGIFANIIRDQYNEDDFILLETMIKDALEHEKQWAHYVYGDNILGISMKSSEQYLDYLGDDRLSRVGRKPIFGSEKFNPYAHLQQSSKSNFFETTVTDYSKADSIEGWDDF